MNVFTHTIKSFDGLLYGTGVIDDVIELVWTERYNSYGDFKMKLPMVEPAYSLLKAGTILRIAESQTLMVVETIEYTFDAVEGLILLVSGRSFESVLSRRIFLNTKIAKAKLHQAIGEFINENVGPSASFDRQFLNFTYLYTTDPAITSIDVDLQIPRGENLYDVVETVCKENNVGFKIYYTMNGELGGFYPHYVFTLYSGVDRSESQETVAKVLFSRTIDNVLNTRYFYTQETRKTYTLVGGEGEGSSQILKEVHPYPSLTALERREIYTDASNIAKTIDGVTMSDADYLAVLNYKGLETLVKNRAVSAFDGDIDPYGMYKYNTDFFLGDIVEIAGIGVSNRSRVTEFIFSWTRSGFKAFPTFEVL